MYCFSETGLSSVLDPGKDIEESTYLNKKASKHNHAIMDLILKKGNKEEVHVHVKDSNKFHRKHLESNFFLLMHVSGEIP